MTDRSALFEIRQIGRAVQVTALDPLTLIEVSLQAPAGTPQSALHRAASLKLARAIVRAGEGHRSC